MLEPKTTEIQLPTDPFAIYDIQTSMWYFSLSRLLEAMLAERSAHPVSLPLSLHMRWPVMRPEGFEFRKSSPFVHRSWKELRLIFTPSTYTAKSYIPASVYAERINTGYGLERAILGIAIWNTEETAKNVTWLEEWPAWIKVYMHSMRVTVDDEQVSNGENFVWLVCTSIEFDGAESAYHYRWNSTEDAISPGAYTRSCNSY